MLSRTDSGRWVAAVLATTLCTTVAGCGFYNVQGRASASAAENLPANVSDVAACVAQSAPGLLADTSTPSLTEHLSDCANTMLLNRDINEAIREADESYGLSYHNSSLAITGVDVDDGLELTLYTEGGGTAQAGVSEARVTLATCWRIVIDEGPDQPKDMSGAPCDEDLVARTLPTELVPFEDLDLAQLGSGDPAPESG